MTPFAAPSNRQPIHVLSGAGLVSGNGDEMEVSAGMVIAYEPREPHGMRAKREELTLLAVIVPHPGSR